MSTSKRTQLIGLFVMSLSAKSFAKETTANTNNVSAATNTTAKKLLC